MSDNLPPTQILSNALEEAIRQRRVKAAVFTTYTFEPGFFEEEVLPLLFDQSWSHMPKVRLVQLEEALRGVEGITVYYDRNALMTSGTPAMLDVSRIPVARDTGGCFHPKLVLLLVEEHDPETEETWEVLIVGVLSANLTRAGWWENVECATFHEITGREKCSFKEDLLMILRLIRQNSPDGENHEELIRIKKFLQYRVQTRLSKKKKRVIQPRMFVGQETLGDFLADTLKYHEDTYNLEIISPYFDNREDARTIQELIETILPKKTRIYLPKSDDGTVECNEAFFNAVNEIPGVKWGTLPRPVVQRSSQATDLQTDRFVHAKVYRIWSRSEGREFLLVGSANLTGAAHSRARQGNTEASMLMEVTNPGKLSFWLNPIDEAPPEQYREKNPTEEDQAEVTAPLEIKFDWDSKIARYFWDREKAPRKIVLLASGVAKIVIDSVRPQTLTSLSSNNASTLAGLLRCTSFLEVAVDGQSAGVIMVSEEGMSQKPSLLMNLTAEEILRYWALLTPEQRQGLIETGVARELEKQGLKPPDIILRKTHDSLFDRFAGIFHAFSQLEQHVDKALEQNLPADAEYRLFGEKHDSLPVFVRKVTEENGEEDSVNRYVQLLTVIQLIKVLESRWPEFFREHRTKKTKLVKMLKKIDTLKTELDLGSGEDAAGFLEWFEKMFLTEAKPQGAK